MHGVPMPSDYLTSPEVGRLLGRSTRTVHRLVISGDLIPAQKLPGPNGAFLFDPDEVAKFCRRRDEQESAA